MFFIVLAVIATIAALILAVNGINDYRGLQGAKDSPSIDEYWDAYRAQYGGNDGPQGGAMGSNGTYLYDPGKYFSYATLCGLAAIILFIVGAN